MTKEEVEQAIRKAHIINRALFVLKILGEKLPVSQLNLKLYLSGAWENLTEEKCLMKDEYKKYHIKLVAPDKDLEAVFIEAENLAKSSFPHRAIGFVCAVRPDWCKMEYVLQFNNDPSIVEDIKFSYQLFKDMLENPNE